MNLPNPSAVFALNKFRPARNIQKSDGDRARNKLKNLIILILAICLLFSILVSIKIYNLDLACRKFEGWTFYSLIPVPTCHADLDIAPFSDLRQSAFGNEVIY